MSKLLLPLLTRAINSYLALDAESKTRLSQFQHDAITIELLPFHFIFQCRFHPQGVDMQAGDAWPARAKLTGTPLQMLHIMCEKEERHAFFAEDLQMEGDAEFGQQVIRLFDELHIDWEEHLSQFIGDIPAHHAGRLIKKFNHWLVNIKDHLAADVSDYIHEEKEWQPTREACQDFFAEIDELRLQADRLEARFHHLNKDLT